MLRSGLDLISGFPPRLKDVEIVMEKLGKVENLYTHPPHGIFKKKKKKKKIFFFFVFFFWGGGIFQFIS